MFQRSHLKIALAGIGMLVSAASHAQDYPTKPITLIVPWPAGGSTDISMRAIAESASKVLGQPIAIDNKAGGGGTVVPATMAAAAKPDGYPLTKANLAGGVTGILQDGTQPIYLHFGSEVDTATAGHLLRIARAISLLGSRCFVSGISPRIAQTMTTIGIGAEGFATFGTLEDALRHALESAGAAGKARR